MDAAYTVSEIIQATINAAHLAVDQQRFELAQALAAIAQAQALATIVEELGSLRLEVAAGNPN